MPPPPPRACQRFPARRATRSAGMGCAASSGTGCSAHGAPASSNLQRTVPDKGADAPPPWPPPLGQTSARKPFHPGAFMISADEVLSFWFGPASDPAPPPPPPHHLH